MLVVLDLGNSALKMGVFDGGRLISTERFEGGASIADEVILPPYVTQADEVIVGASAPTHVPALLRSLGRDARVLGPGIVAAVATTYDDPRELGIDRLAAAWGAREVAGGGRPVVVADVGTAVTVDALDADGRFVAVAIAPGAQTAADGLARAAPHLPRVALGAAMRVPARGTGDSLANGLALGIAGLVDRLVDEAQRALGAPATLVLTGGAARSVASLLTAACRIDAHCVLRGLLALHAAVPQVSDAPTGETKQAAHNERTER